MRIIFIFWDLREWPSLFLLFWIVGVKVVWPPSTFYYLQLVDFSRSAVSGSAIMYIIYTQVLFAPHLLTPAAPRQLSPHLVHTNKKNVPPSPYSFLYYLIFNSSWSNFWFSVFLVFQAAASHHWSPFTSTRASASPYDYLHPPLCIFELGAIMTAVITIV